MQANIMQDTLQNIKHWWPFSRGFFYIFLIYVHHLQFSAVDIFKKFSFNDDFANN